MPQAAAAARKRKQLFPTFEFFWTDANLLVRNEGASVEDSRVITRLLRKKLVGSGFKDVGPLRVGSLVSRGRQFQHGDLFCTIDYYPSGAGVEFWQDVAHENPHGGRYDFSRESKMPYIVRLRYLWIRRRLIDLLVGRGIRERVYDPPSPNPDPLAWFNGHWDGEYERRRGVHRFERDETGWPSDRELNSWSRKDADGSVLHQGDRRYVPVSGRLVPCRVYGGINGMWTCVYGPGRRDWSQESACKIYSFRHWEGRRFPDVDIASKLRAALRKAIAHRHFLRANAIDRECRKRGVRLKDLTARITSA